MNNYNELENTWQEFIPVLFEWEKSMANEAKNFFHSNKYAELQNLHQKKKEAWSFLQHDEHVLSLKKIVSQFESNLYNISVNLEKGVSQFYKKCLEHHVWCDIPKPYIQKVNDIMWDTYCSNHGSVSLWEPKSFSQDVAIFPLNPSNYGLNQLRALVPGGLISPKTDLTSKIEKSGYIIGGYVDQKDNGGNSWSFSIEDDCRNEVGIYAYEMGKEKVIMTLYHSSPGSSNFESSAVENSLYRYTQLLGHEIPFEIKYVDLDSMRPRTITKESFDNKMIGLVMDVVPIVQYLKQNKITINWEDAMNNP
jgi:hypothetical protein